MKLVKLSIPLLLLVIINSEAQIVTSSYGESGMFRMAPLTLIKAPEIGYEQIKGSPYYTSEFHKSDIHFSNGKVYKNIHVRFNLYEKVLEFKRGDQWYKLTNAVQIDKIILEGEEFKLIENSAKLYDNGFYEVELNGEYKVLRQMSVSFREAKVASSRYVETVEAEFVREKDKYYLSLKGGDIVSFKNRKSFEKIFDEENPELINFVKRNKLNPSKVDDLKKIASFLNENS